MGRQSQPCLEQSHHHEVHGSYWVTPCLRIVGPLRCRIWYTRCTSYCFFPGPHSFPTPLAQYSRPRSTPPTSVVTFCPSAPADSCSLSQCFPFPPCSFSPPSCSSFSSCSHTSGCCSSSTFIYTPACSCPSVFCWSPTTLCCSSCPSTFCCSSCPSTFCFSTCSFSICPCTSSNCCTTLKPVPCSG